jgi:aspartyl-tRNA synthetase
MQVSEIFTQCGFKVFADTLAKGGIIKALCVPSGANKYSNTTLKKGDVYNQAIKTGAKGLPFLKVLDNGKRKDNILAPQVLHPLFAPNVRYKCFSKIHNI